MTMLPFLSRLGRDRRGAGAAEFALILPVFLLFFVGLLDAGRFLYEVNQGEKATQIGARRTAVTELIAPQVASQNFVGVTVGGTTLTQGDRIPAAALGLVTCNAAGCTCTASPCPSGLNNDGSTAFNLLLTRMRQIMPSIQASNLVVEYRGSGLGYAGDPNGMDISPLVTVRLAGLTFSPFILFGGDVTLPDFAYTLTMEDGQGTESN